MSTPIMSPWPGGKDDMSSLSTLSLDGNIPLSCVFSSFQEKLPQVSAIHHNNCMYIAHYLLTLGHQYRQSLPPPLSQGAATFVDLIPVFRNLAAESFLAQMVS